MIDFYRWADEKVGMVFKCTKLSDSGVIAETIFKIIVSYYLCLHAYYTV